MAWSMRKAVLFPPGQRACGIHAYGQVAIKADPHAGVVRLIPHLAELLVGQPLQPGEERDPRLLRCGEGGDRGAVGAAQRLGPAPPGPALRILGELPLVQRLEQTMTPQRLPAARRETPIGAATRRRRLT
jgi:hypothetical protein